MYKLLYFQLFNYKCGFLLGSHTVISTIGGNLRIGKDFSVEDSFEMTFLYLLYTSVIINNLSNLGKIIIPISAAAFF